MKGLTFKKFLRTLISLPAGCFLIFAFPASTNYQLKDYNYGGGGVGNGSSSTYSLMGTAGEQSAGLLDGTTYDLGPGLVFTNQANVPSAPTFTNPSNYYNKLQIVLNTGSNPTDTVFAIAISSDNFASDTRYVQSDDTVGSTLGLEDYQTYANWGGGSGTLIIGLAPGTTYTVKVKAMQGKFTETGYGPTASAATVNPQLSFDIDIGTSSSVNNDPPYTINMGDLPAGSVVNSTDKIWVDLDTNGVSGGRVYVSAANNGLYSSTVNHTIASSTGNLSSLQSGFGAQGSTATQGSGGPLSIVTPYDGASDNIGVTDTTIREIFSSSNPITAGRGSFLLKAKSANTTPAAGDYIETLTVIASGSF